MPAAPKSSDKGFELPKRSALMRFCTFKILIALVAISAMAASATSGRGAPRPLTSRDVLYKACPSEINEKSFSENTFIDVKPYPESKWKSKSNSKPFKVFSINSNVASYGNVRHMINKGLKPKKYLVRIEQLVNYFSYDYPNPTDTHPISITTELQPCPWNKNNLLFSIGIKAKEIPFDPKVIDYKYYKVAKDIMAQVEFNPDYIKSIRLIGEKDNCAYNKKEVNELRAGNTVTVFFEIVPADIKTSDVKNDEFMKVRLNYTPLNSKNRINMEVPVMLTDKNKAPSADFTFASAVVMFGQLLHNSEFKKFSSYDYAAVLARIGLGKNKNGQRSEFVRLIEAAKQLQNKPESSFSGVFSLRKSGTAKIPIDKDIYISNKNKILPVIEISDIQKLYNNYLKLKPGFSGEIKFKLTISKKGDIIDISILESTTGYAEFDNSVKDMISKYKWKYMENDLNTVIIPIKFLWLVTTN